MSFIPSFILSALIFCNATVPGGWDEASFTEGIFCEIPYTHFHLSLEGKADELPTLKNAAVIFKLDTLPLTLAAGSLAVSGTGGTDILTPSLPAKDDGTRPVSYFARWRSFSLYATEGRVLLQAVTGSSQATLQNALTAGWTQIAPTQSDDWYLRYSWHPGGNLHSLIDVLTARLFFSNAHLEAKGTVSLSIPDMLPPAASGALNVLLQAGTTETSLAFSANPAHFMTPAGTFSPDLLHAKLSFLYKAGSTFKADTGFVVKQPEKARELSKRLFSAAFSYNLNKENWALGVAVSADRFCFDDSCRDGTLSPALELMLFKTELSAKAAFQPFQDDHSESAGAPAWSLKAARSRQDLSASYTATFSGATLETQQFSVKDERGPLSLSTVITVKQAGLSWSLSFSKAW